MNSVGVRRPMGVVQDGGDAIAVFAVGGAALASWRLPNSSRPDLTVIDALAQLALGARRLGGEIGLRGAGPELLALIDFVGLADVLAPPSGGGVEPGR